MYKPLLKFNAKQRHEVLKHIADMKCYASKNSKTRDWRDSGIGWALEFKNKTDEEIFNAEMAHQIFYDECDNRGWGGDVEINNALRKGKIPVHAVEGLLMYSGGMNTKDYLAIIEGYKGKLHPEVQEELEMHIPHEDFMGGFTGFSEFPFYGDPDGSDKSSATETRITEKERAFLIEVGRIEQTLINEGINLKGKSLDQRIEIILKAKGLSVEEARKRFYNVGEI